MASSGALETIVAMLAVWASDAVIRKDGWRNLNVLSSQQRLFEIIYSLELLDECEQQVILLFMSLSQIYSRLFRQE